MGLEIMYRLEPLELTSKPATRATHLLSAGKDDRIRTFDGVHAFYKASSYRMRDPRVPSGLQRVPAIPSAVQPDAPRAVPHECWQVHARPVRTRGSPEGRRRTPGLRSRMHAALRRWSEPWRRWSAVRQLGTQRQAMPMPARSRKVCRPSSCKAMRRPEAAWGCGSPFPSRFRRTCGWSCDLCRAAAPIRRCPARTSWMNRGT